MLFGAVVGVEDVEGVAGFIVKIIGVVFVCWLEEMRGDERVPGPDGFVMVVWGVKRCGDGDGGVEGKRVLGRRSCSSERWWVPELKPATVLPGFGGPGELFSAQHWGGGSKRGKSEWGEERSGSPPP